MKYSNITKLLIVLIIAVSSCKKTSDDKSSDNSQSVSKFSALQALTSGQGVYDKYVAIISTYTINPADRTNSYSTIARGKILINGTAVNAGPLNVGGVTIYPDSKNLYSYTYSLAQGKALFGTSIPCKINDSTTAGGPVARGNTTQKQTQATIVMPKEFYPSTISTVPGTTLDRTKDYVLNWAPDPNNQNGQVQLIVNYYKGISLFNSTNMPASITSAVYNIADNGTYTIPKADLARFPAGAYVGISISRAWYDNTSSDVAYAGIVEAHTIPLLVYENVSSTPQINGQGTFYFTASVTSGSGRITAPAGTTVHVTVSSGGPSGPYTTTCSISGASFASGGTSLTATGNNGGSVSSTFVMPSTNYVNWSGSFSEPNNDGSGAISVN